MFARIGIKPYILAMIVLCISASFVSIVVAQRNPYVGIPPTPPTKRILYNWNETECWACHYIPAPISPETVQVNNPPKPSFVVEAEPGLRRLIWGSGNNTGAVWSPDGGSIIYVSDRFGNWTLHIIDIESGEEKQLTSRDSISGWPDWSPDGERIAFWSYRGKQSQIYTIKKDGTDEKRLTDDALLKSEPLWSPDGQKMLFGRKDKFWHIWVMDLQTGKQWQVSTGEHNHWAPFWMPDGKEILYYSSDGLVLKLVDVDGHNRRDLTFASYLGELPADLHPRISPDNTKILFNSLRSPNWGLWIMGIDGRNPRRLTYDGSGDRSASWSPDGKKILYSSYKLANPDIRVMNADGSSQTQLTYNKFDDLSPSWHPSGERIAFESNREGKFDVWILELSRPLEAAIVFPKYTYQNMTSQARLTFELKTESIMEIQKVKLHFDWEPQGVYEEFTLEPPVELSSASRVEVRNITFQIPSYATIGYHAYDFVVQFKQDNATLRTSQIYAHTAKDLTVASEERGIYERLHDRVTAAIEFHSGRTQKEGPTELLAEANQELYLAEELALEGKLTEAIEHLKVAETTLKQELPEEKTLPIPIMSAAISVIVFSLITLVYLRRRKVK